MLSKKEIAELTTRIIESVVTNEKMTYHIDAICLAYENIYTTIKKMDQGECSDEE